MVTREELNKLKILKILLRGPTGSSKTYSCVQIAKYVASKGHKVLYLDNERGCGDELEKLDDKVLENIIYVSFRNYKEIIDIVKKYQDEEKDKLRLIIIDPMHLVELTRLSARDAYLDQGYYYLGEKKVGIDNKDTFDLRGFMYQLATTYQMKLLDEIVNCPQDVICTLMTPNKYEMNYDGKFSIVFETFTAWVGNQIFYKATPKKFRGVSLNAMPAIDNPHNKLLEGFHKKYDDTTHSNNNVSDKLQKSQSEDDQRSQSEDDQSSQVEIER